MVFYPESAASIMFQIQIAVFLLDLLQEMPMKTRIGCLLLGCALCVLTSCSYDISADQPINTAFLLRNLYDLDQLALLQDSSCWQFSSYDRYETNADVGNFLAIMQRFIIANLSTIPGSADKAGRQVSGPVFRAGNIPRGRRFPFADADRFGRARNEPPGNRVGAGRP